MGICAEPLFYRNKKIRWTLPDGKKAFKRFTQFFCVWSSVLVSHALLHQAPSDRMFCHKAFCFIRYAASLRSLFRLRRFYMFYKVLWIRCLHCCVPSIDCGKAHTGTPLTPLILNGRPVPSRSQWPWAAALYRLNSTRFNFLCGATLVGDNLVVTGYNHAHNLFS